MNELERNLSLIFFPFIAVVFSILMAISVYKMRAAEEGRRPAEGCRYQSYVSNLAFGYVPLIAAVIFTDFLLWGEPDLSMLPSLIILGVFQCILLALQPLLRKVITARTCASLWTLLPFALFFLSRLGHISDLALLTIPLPLKISAYMLPRFLHIWLAGFAGIMIWHTVTHLLFRRRLLKNARPADSPILHIWAREEALANIPAGSYRVLISPDVKSPLSIGLFRSSLVVILPEKEYSDEELKLILRHELVHVCRRDSLTKLSILFLTALFWFNPLMWIAMRCCADDLELSCDETVLHGYDKDIRRRYANLLLTTVADQRGFTTCLSASARALRYRLKNVVVPRKRLTGGILVGVLCLSMFLGCIFVNFSYNPGTLQEHVFQNQPPDDYMLVDSCIVTAPNQVVADSRDDQPELTAYLFRLNVSPLMKDAEIDWNGDLGQFVLVSPDSKYSLWLTDDRLKVYDPSTRETTYYRVDTTLDWAFMTQQVSQ